MTRPDFVADAICIVLWLILVGAGVALWREDRIHHPTEMPTMTNTPQSIRKTLTVPTDAWVELVNALRVYADPDSNPESPPGKLARETLGRLGMARGEGHER